MAMDERLWSMLKYWGSKWLGVVIYLNCLLTKIKDWPCIIYTQGKYVPHLWIIVGVSTGNRTTGVGPWHSDHSIRSKAMWNISDFKKIPKRGRLLVSDGHKSNEVNLKVDVGQDVGYKARSKCLWIHLNLRMF